MPKYLMNDRVAKKIFRSDDLEKELIVRIVSEVLEEDYEVILANLELFKDEKSSTNNY